MHTSRQQQDSGPTPNKTCQPASSIFKQSFGPSECLNAVTSSATIWRTPRPLFAGNHPLNSLSELVTRLIMTQDSKGANNARTNKLVTDNKNLQSHVDKLTSKKRAGDQELLNLQARVKKLEGELADRKKNFASKQSEFEAEKSTWENKYKQFNNELRKKDNVLKKYSELSSTGALKDAHVVNSVEVVGELNKSNQNKFYGANEVR